MSSSLRRSVPVLYTTGTYYEVGYNMGVTFRSLIQDFFLSFTYLHQDYIPFYNTGKGKELYNGYLKTCERIFPHYMDELRGLAKGAEIAFHEIFLVHLAPELDTFLGGTDFGCTTIYLNSPNQLLIAHNEDACPEAENRSYFVHAHIIDHSFGEAFREEKWLSYCYPGHLAGYSMGTNYSGLVYSINILYPQKILPNKIPTQILTRAILAAQDINHLEKILYNEGCGCAGGFSVNVGFLNSPERILWNFEVAPCSEKAQSLVQKVQVVQDEMNTDNTKPRGLYSRYNKYNFIEIEIMDKSSSEHREAVIKNLKCLRNVDGLLKILSDTSDSQYPVFRTATPPDSGLTLCTGVFDLMKRTWAIYVGNYNEFKDPLIVFPLVII